MLIDYLPIIFVFLLAAGFAITALIATQMLSPRVKSAVKQMPYESGVDPVGPTHIKINVRYFIVALVFIIFDIEIIFLYPWAVIFKDFLEENMLILYEMIFFLAVLFVGYVYIWRKGVFEWE